MKLLFSLLSLVLISNFVVPSKCWSISLGQEVPAFKLLNEENTEIDTASFKGKFVVLEWLNHGCPFVRKHYDSGNMQALQKKFTSQDVIWLSVISSAPGKQGHSSPQEAKSHKAKYKSFATHILLDPKGEVGGFMGAKTTPHIFILGKQGEVLYQGAIDSVASADMKDIKGAENYLDQALTAALAGKEIKTRSTKAYGCSVKY